jgi:fructose-1,6-bisphosphatase/inositol monophosphatase family enzyme
MSHLRTIVCVSGLAAGYAHAFNRCSPSASTAKRETSAGAVDAAARDEVLALAKTAALAAGAVIRKAWSGTSAIRDTKSNATDLVTETDQQCEDIIVKLIRAKFPQHDIIGEETTGAGQYQLTSAPTWTIDPIDGTTNFVHRIPQSCVIIAFVHEKEVLVGVTYDPMADELYWATKGGGAFMKSPRYEGPISVSNTTAISQAVVGVEVGYARDPQAISMVQ